MGFLIQQIIWFVAITAVVWFAVGWKLREGRHQTFVRAMDQEHEHKLLALRQSRDDYRDQLEQVAATNGDGKLTQDQRSQIAAHIRKLENEVTAGREQIATLGTKLNAIGTTAKQRDAEYRRLQARLDEATRAAAPTGETPPATTNDAELAAKIAEQQQIIARLNARIEGLSKQQNPSMATAEHARLLSVIRAQKTTIANLARRAETADVAPDAPAPAPQTATGKQERAQLKDTMREQARTIRMLKEQLHQKVTPPPRQVQDATTRSGDLFASPPAVLMRAPEGTPDNLQKIRGVGPVLEGKLNELGIFHFRQIARLSKDDIGWIAVQINAFPNRILRDRWVSQAAKLADEQSSGTN